MFLTLGLLVEPRQLLNVVLIASLVGLFLILVGRPLSVYLCLKPFKNISAEARKFISWVGLRGAVPIIFATYPYVAKIEGADLIFDTVFFITIISLILQGTTVPSMARKLGLVDESCEHKQFAIELPSDLAVTSEITVTPQLLVNGKKLCNIELPSDALIMMIKRGEKFFIPNYKTPLMENDKLLIIAATKEELQDAYAKLGIAHYEIYKD
jgi:cell volume regulation protein A